MLKLVRSSCSALNRSARRRRSRSAGGGITCIVGPNGCGTPPLSTRFPGCWASRATRCSAPSVCPIAFSTARPNALPLGLAEVTLTLVDPDLAEAAAKVLEGPHVVSDTESSEPASPVAAGTFEEAGPAATGGLGQPESEFPAEEFAGKHRKERAADKPAVALKPGEVVVARRLYRSGQTQSEYLSPPVARLRAFRKSSWASDLARTATPSSSRDASA